MNPNDQLIFDETEHLFIRPLAGGDAAVLLDFYRHNRNYFAEWEPLRDEAFYTLEGMQAFIAAGERDERGIYSEQYRFARERFIVEV